MSGRCIVLGVVVLVVGCVEPPPPSGLLLERELHRASCARALDPDCLRNPSVVDVEQCIEANIAGSSLARARAIDERRIVVDDAEREACLAGFECVRSSYDPFAAPLACERMFVGTLGVGAACGVNEECARGLQCTGRTPPSFCGVCTTRPEIGAACTPADACIEPEDRDARNACFGGVCVRFLERTAGEGEVCGPLVSASESVIARCAPGTACVTIAGVGRCSRPGQLEGAPCARPFDTCEGDLVCTSAGVCGPDPTIIEARLDAPCGEVDAAVIACDRDAGLVCLVGRCRPIGTAGDACDSRASLPCEAGLYCGAEGLCMPPLAERALCFADIQCASMVCSPAFGECSADNLCTGP